MPKQSLTEASKSFRQGHNAKESNPFKVDASPLQARKVVTKSLLGMNPKQLQPAASISSMKKESPVKSLERKSTAFWLTQKDSNNSMMTVNEKSFYTSFQR